MPMLRPEEILGDAWEGRTEGDGGVAAAELAEEERLASAAVGTEEVEEGVGTSGATAAWAADRARRRNLSVLPPP